MRRSMPRPSRAPQRLSSRCALGPCCCSSRRSLVATGAAAPSAVRRPPPRAHDGGEVAARRATPGAGSWMAIEVDLDERRASRSGELRLAGGAQGRTRFGDAGRPPDRVATRPTSCMPSRRRSGARSRSSLVSGATTIATTKATYLVHDATAAGRRHHRRATGRHHRRHRPAAQPEQRRAAHRRD